MWLLELHFSISFLLLIASYVLVILFKEKLKANGWIKQERKKNAKYLMVFLVPIINVMVVIFLLLMIGHNEEELKQILNDHYE